MTFIFILILKTHYMGINANYLLERKIKKYLTFKSFLSSFKEILKSAMSEKKLYSLNYFNKVGKINLIHLIFAACDVPYEENRIEKLTDSGITNIMNKNIIDSVLILLVDIFIDIQQGFLPFLKVNQCEIPCISVISRFLAKDFGIAGESNIDQVRTIQ